MNNELNFNIQHSVFIIRYSLSDKCLVNHRHALPYVQNNLLRVYNVLNNALSLPGATHAPPDSKKNNKDILMNKTYAVFASFLLGWFLFPLYGTAQEETTEPEIKLTHVMSPEEAARKHEIGKGFMATDPPAGPVRNVSEFEQMEGVLIRYPLGISYSVIAAISQRTKVTTIVTGQTQENTVKSLYQSNGVNMANCNFLWASSNSYWTRDYGPWYIFYGSDQCGIIDFIYNRPRPQDDLIPQKVATFLGISWFGMDLVHTGGNYMTEGYGISSSTELVWEENTSLTHQQINQLMNSYLGINTYHVVPDPNNTYIDHIDCWGKFLDVDKILIRQVPPSHAQYDEIEATAAFYAAQTSAWGNNYQVYRVNTPNNQPYTNSLIVNKTVYVPIMGSSYDAAALTSYQQAMPGYEVLGFTGSWESTDALHCRTNGIADKGMLFIRHYPLLGIQPNQSQYSITAEITAHSQQALIADSVKIYYKVNSGSYTPVQMTWVSGKTYTAVIPGQPVGSQISYYIHAADQSGRSANHPFIGAPDPHVFYVGSLPAPNISLSQSSLGATLAPDAQTTELLGVSNIGQLPLTFTAVAQTSEKDGWLSVTPPSGSIPAGSSQNLDVVFNSTGLSQGTYAGSVIISSNDPDQPQVIIPCTLQVSGGLVVSMKVYLEGPYNGTAMNTSLNPAWLPLSQPYQAAPWNYPGTESVASIPAGNIVDWVLVELRDAATAAQATGGTMIARQAAFLKSNGEVIQTDGASPLLFPVTPVNNLYAVIWHRNHLGIMSANPLIYSGGIYSYDFTDAAGKAYGGSNGHKQIGVNAWGMIAADGDANRQVDNQDKNNIWALQAGLSGYLPGDFSMNGQVDNLDKVDLWGVNSGRGSQVPY